MTVTPAVDPTYHAAHEVDEKVFDGSNHNRFVLFCVASKQKAS